MNYFSLFGLPVRYQIDIQLLRSLFQDLQRKNHPDNFANSDQSVKEAAITKSSLINQAWHTLRNPITRAEHLLLINGFDCTNECNLVKDCTFLIQQFELRKELEEIEKTKNTVKLNEFITNIQAMIDNYCKNIEKQLNEKNWQISSLTLHKLRIFNALKNSAETLEEKLMDF